MDEVHIDHPYLYKINLNLLIDVIVMSIDPDKRKCVSVCWNA
jgi:hypothetical protein